jgi:hypothetical protein
MLGTFEAPPAAAEIRVGDRVEHDHFGRGTVERLGDRDRPRATCARRPRASVGSTSSTRLEVIRKAGR